ncbi:uncharacterized protein LOC128233741 [Mya arenaria]|uniref:uncharacterized protein LOC128233741 n=1 Tax=Mya arenaria TaxID=6604 RepID=UPI0022E86296|nr:uncharacterized protein LOC128233741 [Mya arenaria]XP_052803526.1 uncharacterized protein LOC128233741 [Mya arenaria]
MRTPVLLASILLLLLHICCGIAYHLDNNEVKTTSNLGDIVSVPEEENGTLSRGLIVLPHSKNMKQTVKRTDGHTIDTYSNHGTVSSVEKAELNGQEDSVSEECVIEVEKPSLDRFRHLVFRADSNFVFLNLTSNYDSGIHLKKAKWTIAENIWIWTFYGKEGALEFLKWPTEFGIWSMGLLYESVIRKPIEISLKRITGNCSKLEVGKKDDDLVIAKALTNLTLEMMSLDLEKYAPSFYCYRKRMIIDAYVLCKHIVCPIEAVKHSCCNFFFNKTLNRRVMSCKEIEFEYDEVWWIFPSILSTVLLIYSPLFLMYILYHYSERESGRLRLNVLNGLTENTITFTQDNNESMIIHSQDEYILFDGINHVTLLNTICIPLNMSLAAMGCFTDVLKRSVRLLIPVLSLTFVGLQVVLDYKVLYKFVHDCVESGVPMGFRSMLTGYDKSKNIFLPYIGGPFVALSCYLIITGVLVLAPSDPARLLSDAVVASRSSQSNPEASPLFLSLNNIEIFGAMNLKYSKGFRKIYNIFLAQFYMLMNVKFWKHIFKIQTARWNVYSKCCLCVIVFPLYFILCCVEIFLSVIIYGFPIVSFGRLIIKAYCIPFNRGVRRCRDHICMYLFTGCLILSVVYFIFMFATIFSDAILFLTRVAIFTFTGIIVFPKTAYGYMIFGFTVFYYLSNCFSDFSMNYSRLMKDIIKLTKGFQRHNENTQKKVLFKHKDKWGIRESLFELAIENHSPRRKLLFSTLLRAFVVLGLLGICINMLSKTDSFRELHVIMHVGTALFICALPQIVNRVCKKKDSIKALKRRRKALVNTVKAYLGYFADSETSDSEVNGV